MVNLVHKTLRVSHRPWKFAAKLQLHYRHNYPKHLSTINITFKAEPALRNSATRQISKTDLKQHQA